MRNLLSWLGDAVVSLEYIARRAWKKFGFAILALLFGIGAFFTRQYWLPISSHQDPYISQLFITDLEITLRVPDKLSVGTSYTGTIGLEVKAVQPKVNSRQTITVSFDSPDTGVHFNTRSQLLTLEANNSNVSATSTVSSDSVRWTPSHASLVTKIQAANGQVAAVTTPLLVESIPDSASAVLTAIITLLGAILSVILQIRNLRTGK
jgi:hypothetical protein